MVEITLETLDAKLNVILERLVALGERVSDLEDRVEMVQGSITRIDGHGVEAMALLRMMERHDRRIKALEERVNQ
jgi:hypothetical protein